jgi:hypothetical protein
LKALSFVDKATHLPLSSKVTDLVGRFYAYHVKHRGWRNLSLVLEDFKTDDNSVAHCIRIAIDRGDPEGEKLGKLLFGMSRKERRRISWLVEEM